ncbi:MAG: dihydroorotate dehydrogenase electron transfer subunit [Christensenellaceae bacterium]|nr:dihydroorotate dehydrogenase electron transfer subunit [Christensenellaceae bacterium]
MISKILIAKDVYKYTLQVENFDIEPGQFVNLSIPGFFLKRPISVSDYDGKKLSLIFKTIGEGTKSLVKNDELTHLDMLLPLGNCYSLDKSVNKNTYVVGGGLGVPPMLYLCKKLIEAGQKPKVVLGFNSSKDVFLHEDFQALGIELIVCTVDGSYGQKGMVTDFITNAEYIYACGPLPMLNALSKTTIDGQFSFETRMCCGFGACMGCTMLTKKGAQRVCKEGPIFYKEDIIWS